MPQTKEDILSSKESISDNFVSYYPWKSALEAMDEYAEQQATNFALWVMLNGWRINAFDNTNFKWINLKHDPSTLSSSELYKLYREFPANQTKQ